MNWKHKLYPNSLMVLLGLIIIITTFVSFGPQKDQQEQNKISQDIKSKTLKELTYEKLSPDGLNKIISYKTVFDSSFYRDYYKEYFNNNRIVSIRDKDGEEDYLFTGERIDEPEWLGNEHVFFTSYCGSSCQGIYLVNVFNKETRLGVLSYITFEDSKPSYTIFKDWFGHEFKFKGFADEIRSEIVGNRIYLIFYMRDDEQKSTGQKRFLFTGNALKE